MSTQFKATADVAQQAQPGRVTNVSTAYQFDPRRDVVHISAEIAGLISFPCGLAVGFTMFTIQPLKPFAFYAFPLSLVAFVTVFILFIKRPPAWLETLTGKDLNGDGKISKPKKDDKPVRIIVNNPNGETGQDWIDLPYRELLPELAAGVLDGKPFTVGAWVGNGRPFTRSEFEALRGEMITRGLIEWKNPGNPNQGVSLTRTGRVVFGKLAEEYEQ